MDYLLTQAKIWVLDCTFNEIKDSKDTLEELVVDFEMAVPKALESLFGKEFVTNKVKGCNVRAPANGEVPLLT